MLATNLQNNIPPIRTAFISGGTRGIGRAAVELFADSGYRVAFCYKTNDKLAHDIVTNCQTKGQFVCGFKYDIVDFKQVEKLFLEVKKTFGFVDTLVNNAGISHKGLFLDTTIKEVENIFNANFNSVFNLTKAFSSDMLNNSFGRIINVSSVFAKKGASVESIYSSSKAAVEALTRSLAKEFGLNGITVNAVAPGFIDTDMNNNLSFEEKNEFINSLTIKRAGTPKEVAHLLLFLASEKASYITGETINISGGH